MNGRRKRDILIAVTGLTPQVITETVYYFYKLRKPPKRIKEIYVITTLPSKEKIIESLFKNGRFNELCKRLKIKRDDIKFDEDNIYLIPDKNGNPLKDIRTINDNEQVAERIWKTIEAHTKREDVVLHCSVAGGRKTMGVYAALVMSLLGREGDTLSHILVDEEKESSDFYFPITKQDEKKLSLAEIPYVRLGEVLKITSKKVNFVQRIKLYQRELDERFLLGEVKIEYEDNVLNAGKLGKVKFSEREFIIYSLLAYTRKQCVCKDGCSKCFLDIPAILQQIPEYLKKYEKYFSERKLNDKETIYEIISRIGTKIEKEDILKKDFFKIQQIGRRGDLKYGLKIPPHKIKLQF